MSVYEGEYITYLESYTLDRVGMFEF